MTNAEIEKLKQDHALELLAQDGQWMEISRKQAEEIEKRGTEIDVLRADVARYEAEIAQLKGNLKAMTSFADLWYFVMDEKPLAFEKIVNEYSPAQWMHQAYLLKERTKK